MAPANDGLVRARSLVVERTSILGRHRGDERREQLFLLGGHGLQRCTHPVSTALHQCFIQVASHGSGATSGWSAGVRALVFMVRT